MIGVVRTGLGARVPSRSHAAARCASTRRGPARLSSSSQVGSYSLTRAGRISVSHAAAGASKPSSCDDDAGDRIGAFDARFGRDALPLEQEAHEVARRHRLDLLAQPVHGVAMDAREQAPLAPLDL